MNKAKRKLLEMLTYKRKEGSVAQQLFNDRFIRPMMGKPDQFNNYICEVLPNGKILQQDLVVYPRSHIAFMAHHDTVHKTDGRQKVCYDPHADHAYVDGTECLGADCTTGVWLILEMIKSKVPGLYIVHTGEECGGIGSRALVKSFPKWLETIDVAISFDRFGTDSIITHQMGQRTCSEAFASDLESILNLNLKSDSGGVYTDSYEYCDFVSECTNISVGYFNHHTKSEYQDMDFAMKLRDSLIKADWSIIKGYRDPTVVEYDDWHGQRGWYASSSKSSFKSQFDDEYYNRYSQDDVETLCNKYKTTESFIKEFSYEIVELLFEMGYDKRTLIEEVLKNHSRF